MSFNNLLTYFNKDTNESIIYSFILILVSLILYYFFKTITSKLSWSYEKKLKHLATVRNSLLFFVIFVSLVMFGGHLKTFIYSAAAIFSAFLILFREIILSIVGFIVSNRTYYVGDYVSYDNNKGLIMDKSPFNTKIWLIDTYHNEILTIPNFNYLNQKIIKYPKYGKYVSYTIVVSIEPKDEFSNLVNKFKSSVNIINSETLNMRMEYFSDKVSQGKIKETPDLMPVFGYDLNDSKNYKIYATLIIHPSDAIKVKDRILATYIND